MAGPALVALGCGLLAYASPAASPLAGRPLLDAAAGLALAVVYNAGPRLLAPVALGAWLGCAAWSRSDCARETCDWALGDAAVYAAITAIQAGLGAWLLGRVAGRARLLAEPREILGFFAAAAGLPGALGALLAGLHELLGGLPPLDAARSALAHALAVMLGVMICAPIAWAWLGRPRADWAPRRWPLTLTGLTCIALVHAGLGVLAHADARRTRAELEGVALHAATLLGAGVQDALHGLQAMHSLFVGSEDVSREEFRAASAFWLGPASALQALGWSQCLRHDEIAGFEAHARAEGLGDLRVLSATGDGAVRAPRADEPLAVIRYIEPQQPNRLAPGINSMANPATGAAIRVALLSGSIATSASFPLRLPDGEADLGVVLYRSVPARKEAAASGCGAPAQGLVFATMRLSRLWSPIAAAIHEPFAICLVDRSAALDLAGARGCDQHAGALRRVESLVVGDRYWDLVVADTRTAGGALAGLAPMLGAAGLAGSAVLMALLLAVTGRARRIEAAVADAQAARRAAEAANRAKSSFLSRMSHELRTPLNAVLGFAQLLQQAAKPPLPDEQGRWAAGIRQAGAHLLAMIDDVLDLSRIESDSLALRIDALDLGALVGEALTLLRQRADERSVALQVEPLPDDARWVRGDATRVRQALTNLLSNAIKYNRVGGEVRLRAARAGERIELEVRDNGIGMDAAQLAQLYQPFNRLGRERSGVEGTGIGLVICQRLAALMDGELRVESQPDRGSTFTLALPAAGANAAPIAPAAEPAPAAPLREGLRVHYVEDNPINVDIVRAALARLDGVRFDASTTGEEAQRRLFGALAERPDLILLDLHLPDIDGMTLLRRLQADADTAAIPVVVLSADAMSASVAAALAAGACDYLTKPLQFERLHTVLQRHGSAPAQPLR